MLLLFFYRSSSFNWFCGTYFFFNLYAFIFVNFYYCTTFKLLCNYNSFSSSVTDSKLFTLVGLKLTLKFESDTRRIVMHEDANVQRILILVTSAETLNAVQYENLWMKKLFRVNGSSLVIHDMMILVDDP